MVDQKGSTKESQSVVTKEICCRRSKGAAARVTHARHNGTWGTLAREGVDG
jgi:hypothetical protein